MYKNLIFDLDNTLIECSCYYIDRYEQFGKYQENRTGLPAKLCIDLLKKIDVSFTETPDGFSRHRFPRAFAAASVSIDIMVGHEVNWDAAKHSFDTGNSVFDAPYCLLDGAEEILQQYKDGGFNLFLLTKGDPEVQTNKVIKNGLDKFFDPNNCYVVDRKTSEDIEEIINGQLLQPNETVMIGDSMKDDIGSAIGAGIHSVHLVDPLVQGQWAYENTSNVPTYTINSIVELTKIINPSALLVHN